MFKFELDDPFQTRLADPADPGASDVLAQQHAEIRSGEGTGFIFFYKIYQRKGCAGRKQQALLAVRPFCRDNKRVRFRLSNLIEPTTVKVLVQFPDHGGDGNSVECHCFNSW